MAKDDIEGRAVTLREEAEPAAAISPLETLSVPGLLDGSGGSNRADPVRSSLRASNDLEAVRAWLSARASNPNTRSAYRKEAERFLLWCIAEEGTALSSITVEEASLYPRFLEDLGRLADAAWAERWRLPEDSWIGPKQAERGTPSWRPFSGPLSHTSRRQALVVVRMLFSFLVKTGYLRTNPFEQVPPKVPYLPGESAPKEFADRSLSEEEWGAVLRHLGSLPESEEKARLEVVLMMGKGLGMRASEMLAARTGWFGTRRIGRTPVAVVNVIGKGDKVRSLPVQKAHLDAVDAYLAARGLPPAAKCPPDTPVLASLGRGKQPKARAQALSRSGLHRALKKFLDGAAAEVESMNPFEGEKLRAASTHWLRHTFAETALEAMPVNVVQTALGHRSLATTSLYLVPTAAKLAEGMKGMKPL